MTTNSAYAPYNPTYLLRTPYITAAEYTSAPTAMDVNNLIAGGNAAANQQALIETIGRASSWVDQFTCGAWGTLAATVEIENGRVWGNRQGQLIVHPKYWPLLELQTFSYSPFGQNFAASITPAGNVWIEPQQFTVNMTSGINVWGSFSTQFGGFGGIGIAGGQQYQCTFSYVSGWPTSTLSASVAAGANSIMPTSVTGIYPGTQLTIYDLPYDESFIVSSSYVPGSAIVPINQTLQFNHASGIMVTNLPPAIKQATISATTALIKQRGSGAMIVSDIGDQRTIDSGSGTGVKSQDSDWALAQELLQPFKTTFVGY